MMNTQKPCHKGILALNGVGYSFIKNKNIIWLIKLNPKVVNNHKIPRIINIGVRIKKYENVNNNIYFKYIYHIQINDTF